MNGMEYNGGRSLLQHWGCSNVSILKGHGHGHGSLKKKDDLHDNHWVSKRDHDRDHDRCYVYCGHYDRDSDCGRDLGHGHDLDGVGCM